MMTMRPWLFILLLALSMCAVKLCHGQQGFPVRDLKDYSGPFNPSEVNIGPTSWRYSATNGGQLEIVFPGGTAAMYEAGSPLVPYFYFPGRVLCDVLESSELSANTLEGVIPPTVMQASLGLLSSWTVEGSQSAGIPYAATGPEGASEPTPALGTYFPTVYVEDGGTTSTNSLLGRYRSREQFAADLLPTATAAIDWPEIAAGATNTQTVTVTGAVTTNTPTVQVGWNGALSTGLILAQAWVSAANTVSVSLTNISGSPINPASITVRVSVQLY